MKKNISLKYTKNKIIFYTEGPNEIKQQILTTDEISSSVVIQTTIFKRNYSGQPKLIFNKKYSKLIKFFYIIHLIINDKIK